MYARKGMRGPLAQIVYFSFRGPLKSQWALQVFEDTLLGMRGVCAAQGNGVPRKAVPAKRSGKACLCKTGMRKGMRTIYICTFVCVLVRRLFSVFDMKYLCL